MNRKLPKKLEETKQRHPKHPEESFVFLQEALHQTLNQIKTENSGNPRHISGKELLLGFRDYALNRFGPMTLTVLNEWNISCCRDIGEMVFYLIKVGVFLKQESDSLEDFQEVFDFKEAFISPYL